MNQKDAEEIVSPIDEDMNAGLPPELPVTLSQDERYFALLTTALRKCLLYKPRFGQGRAAGVSAQEFAALYASDPFYHWLGIDSPLMYAAHKAAGGMTSVYRQIGIGSQWIFFQMLQDHFGLTPEQATWSYSVEGREGKQRKLSLDGRIDLDDLTDARVRERVQTWLTEVAAVIGLPSATLESIKGVVFEARQGYKSKDSKRQNADIANASKAYAHLYIPAILLFSTQIDSDVAHRYRDNLWLLLTGTVNGSPAISTYAFCREIVGYDLASFFQRYSPQIKGEVEAVLKALLTPE